MGGFYHTLVLWRLDAPEKGDAWGVSEWGSEWESALLGAKGREMGGDLWKGIREGYKIWYVNKYND